MKFLLLLAACILTTAALAADLPDAPSATRPPTPVYDRQLWVATAVHFGIRAVDDARTCSNLANGGHEDVYPTQSCAGIVAWNAGVFAALAVTSYELAKHGHRKLALAAQYIGATVDSAGVIYSFTGTTNRRPVAAYR